MRATRAHIEAFSQDDLFKKPITSSAQKGWLSMLNEVEAFVKEQFKDWRSMLPSEMKEALKTGGEQIQELDFQIIIEAGDTVLKTTNKLYQEVFKDGNLKNVKSSEPLIAQLKRIKDRLIKIQNSFRKKRGDWLRWTIKQVNPYEAKQQEAFQVLEKLALIIETTINKILNDYKKDLLKLKK